MSSLAIRRGAASRRSSAGFSMIEVLVSLVVLGIGLLGLALLQTMNLRFTQSANQRSMAVNLAYELLDQVRANRIDVQDYLAITPGSFAGVTPPTGCTPVADGTTLLPTHHMTRWRCEVRDSLGANAQAEFLIPNPGQVSIEITWADDPGNDPNAEFTLETQL